MKLACGEGLLIVEIFLKWFFSKGVVHSMSVFFSKGVVLSMKVVLFFLKKVLFHF